MSDTATHPGISQLVRFDRELITRYDRSGPRYTSYPTAPHFHSGFGPEQFRAAAAASNVEGRPLSLYLHIPFCDTVCHYCACNRVVTNDRSRAVEYLDYLEREIAQMGALFDRSRPVMQLHLGGGTPTFLSSPQLMRLRDMLARHFTLLEDDSGEYGIEVDPREVPGETIFVLRQIGFNRISIGVQDLEPKVQDAVNRFQPLALSRRSAQLARDAGFQSLNVDLIYGLPFQSRDTFERTLSTVIRELDPDRFAIFNYAHLPQYFPAQRRIHEADLPSAEEKLAILERSIQVLTSAGYVYIGMDHFAKPGDELAVAQRQGKLHRNFQGYTTHGECDLIGLGSTAISQVGATYAQNLKELPEYYQRVQQGELAVFRGLTLTADDLLRREVILRLICDFQLDRQALGERFGIDFRTTFAREEGELARMVDEGLLGDDGQVVRVTPAGRLLIRNICMIFDWYLNNTEQMKSFSRTI